MRIHEELVEIWAMENLDLTIVEGGAAFVNGLLEGCQ